MSAKKTEKEIKTDAAMLREILKKHKGVLDAYKIFVDKTSGDNFRYDHPKLSEIIRDQIRCCKFKNCEVISMSGFKPHVGSEEWYGWYNTVLDAVRGHAAALLEKCDYTVAGYDTKKSLIFYTPVNN